MPELSDFTTDLSALYLAEHDADNGLSAIIALVEAMPFPYRSEHELDTLRAAAELVTDIAYAYRYALMKAQGLPLPGTPCIHKFRSERFVTSRGVVGETPDRYDTTRIKVNGADSMDIAYAADLEPQGAPLETWDAQMAWIKDGALPEQ